MLTMTNPRPVVIDIGTGTTRVGFAGDPVPTVVIPSIVGTPNASGLKNTLGQKTSLLGKIPSEMHQIVCSYFLQPPPRTWGQTSSWVGNLALQKREIMDLSSPIGDNGFIDWDTTETLLSYSFQELEIDPKDHPVFFTNNALTGEKRMIEEMTQKLFERFGFPKVNSQFSPICSLYASGRGHDGIVLDIGESVCIVAPVSNGWGIPHDTYKLPYSGSNLDTFLMKSLVERGYDLRTTPPEVIAEIKEKFCYVALDFEEEMKNTMCARSSDDIEKNFKLPNGETISIGNERFRCPEVLFQPSRVGGLQEDKGVVHFLQRSISKNWQDKNLQNDLYGNVVLTGGSSLFPGIEERIQKDLFALANPDPSQKQHTVTVSLVQDPRNSAWRGASIFCQNPSLSYLEYEDYMERGPELLHRHMPRIPEEKGKFLPRLYFY